MTERPAQFIQIAAATNPNSGTPSLFAIDHLGRVWQYIHHPKGGGSAYWLALSTERRIDE
jgi:hypothetical protein